jgi:hypothetical protein
MSELTGVYVRLQNTKGVLWSSSRESQAEVEADLEVAFGEEITRAIMESLKSGFTVNTTPPAAPQLVTVSGTVADLGVEDEAVQRAEAILQQASMPEEPQGQFESCNICGTPKDQWKPPGISNAGKKYPGFFGCPNFRNHPR